MVMLQDSMCTLKTTHLTYNSMFMPLSTPSMGLMVLIQPLLTIITRPLIIMLMQLLTIITLDIFITLIMMVLMEGHITTTLTGGMRIFK